LNDEVLTIPIMCNPGTKEGVTVKEGRFAVVWPSNEAFFNEVRGKGGLICVAVDPLTAHECGNQRYLAIPWFDACLTARLPATPEAPLKPTPVDKAWLAPLDIEASAIVAPVPAVSYALATEKSIWFLDEAVAKAWAQYVKDTAVSDLTPPPPPTQLKVIGNELTWKAEADLQSGLDHFIIERDGQFLARVPEVSKNPYGRPIFQNLQYSDTPTQPLVEMKYIDTKPVVGKQPQYRVITVNTVGLRSD
jgi:hypothetical protein